GNCGGLRDRVRDQGFLGGAGPWNRCQYSSLRMVFWYLREVFWQTPRVYKLPWSILYGFRSEPSTRKKNVIVASGNLSKDVCAGVLHVFQPESLEGVELWGAFGDEQLCRPEAHNNGR